MNVPGGTRMTTAACLLHLCNEHHQAIDLLVSHRVNGSAFALFRPQFDAYVRAHWLFYQLNDQQISDFLDEKLAPPLKNMIASVETLPHFSSNILSKTYDRLYATMCSFTHGGGLQVTARVANGQIEESYRPKHVFDLLRTSAYFSMLASHALAQMTKNLKVEQLIVKEFERIYGA